jgi:hypothetical protein
LITETDDTAVIAADNDDSVYNNPQNDDNSTQSKLNKNKVNESKVNIEAQAPDDLFSEFWNAYPKKVAKQDAEKAFNKIKPDRALLDIMLDAIEAQKIAKEIQIANKQFCPEWPYPATWLNGKRWTDEQQDKPAEKHQIPSSEIKHSEVV